MEVSHRLLYLVPDLVWVIWFNTAWNTHWLDFIWGANLQFGGAWAPPPSPWLATSLRLWTFICALIIQYVSMLTLWLAWLWRFPSVFKLLSHPGVSQICKLYGRWHSSFGAFPAWSLYNLVSCDVVTLAFDLPQQQQSTSYTQHGLLILIFWSLSSLSYRDS